MCLPIGNGLRLDLFQLKIPAAERDARPTCRFRSGCSTPRNVSSEPYTSRCIPKGGDPEAVRMEKKVDPVKARQGRWGTRVLTVLICSLILAGIGWAGLEIYGEHLANEPAAIHLQQNKSP